MDGTRDKKTFKRGIKRCKENYQNERTREMKRKHHVKQKKRELTRRGEECEDEKKERKQNKTKKEI